MSPRSIELSERFGKGSKRWATTLSAGSMQLRASDWGLVAFAGLMAGGSYVCLQRRAAKGPGSNADDESSWFLTQWHNSSEHA